jgi:hypothetical protein
VRVSVTHTLGDLVADLEQLPVKFAQRAPVVVALNAQQGNHLASGYANEEHGYPGDEDAGYAETFTAEKVGGLAWEYGPEAHGEGSKSPGYEHGSINSPPHHDLARSADLIGPALADDAGDMLEGLFW